MIQATQGQKDSLLVGREMLTSHDVWISLHVKSDHHGRALTVLQYVGTEKVRSF
jgi:cation transport regulator ChaC